MANPQFIEQKPLALADVQDILEKIEKRDKELNYRSTKSKEYLDSFGGTLTAEKKDELFKKLTDLNLTRIKEEHLMKIIDFLPATVGDLKVVLAAYPLSLPKKDMDSLVGVVKGFA
jgi:DNA-directed RNA polymerase subunit F